MDFSLGETAAGCPAPNTYDSMVPSSSITAEPLAGRGDRPVHAARGRAAYKPIQGKSGDGVRGFVAVLAELRALNYFDADALFGIGFARHYRIERKFVAL